MVSVKIINALFILYQKTLKMVTSERKDSVSISRVELQTTSFYLHFPMDYYLYNFFFITISWKNKNELHQNFNQAFEN